VAGKNPVQRSAITNVCLLEGVAWAICYLGKGFQIARVSEFVEINDAVLGGLNKVANKRRTNKTGSAGNQNFHREMLCRNMKRRAFSYIWRVLSANQRRDFVIRCRHWGN